MTTAQIAKRVAYWQKRLSYLGVGHWRVKAVGVVDQVPGHSDTADAAAWTSNSYDVVEFFFQREWVDGSDEEGIDETIIHEWLHVAFRDFDNSVMAVQGWMPDATYADFRETVDHEREGLIDRLARQICAAHSET